MSYDYKQQRGSSELLGSGKHSSCCRGHPLCRIWCSELSLWLLPPSVTCRHVLNFNPMHILWLIMLHYMKQREPSTRRALVQRKQLRKPTLHCRMYKVLQQIKKGLNSNKQLHGINNMRTYDEEIRRDKFADGCSRISLA